MRRVFLSVGLAVAGAISSANAQSTARTEPVAEPERIVYSWKDAETTFAFEHGETVLANRVQFRWRERPRQGRSGERLFNIPRARTEVTG
jgi:hypothetical protein